jgi:hypothetical protein
MNEQPQDKSHTQQDFQHPCNPENTVDNPDVGRAAFSSPQSSFSLTEPKGLFIML